MRISDWSSDVCSSDLDTRRCPDGSVNRRCHEAAWGKKHFEPAWENKALRLLPVSEPALDPWLWLARRQSDRLDLAELALDDAGGAVRRPAARLGRAVLRPAAAGQPPAQWQLGRASCRERVCQYG